MVKVLFVCHGNICRSPMAEYMFKDMIKNAGLTDWFEIASAATHSDEIGNGVYPPAKRKLAEHGISCSGHAAHRMTKAEYGRYDYIICMDRANLRDLMRLSGGDPDGKVSLMLDHAGRPGEEVADPWYTGDFNATWNDLDAGLANLFAELTGPEY